MPTSLFLNTSSQEKEPKFLREMADSKSGAEKVQNEPGIICARKQVKKDGDLDTRTRLKSGTKTIMRLRGL